uniref:Uncharacterized protein n=1 Tax=Timema tahoe TaxID=61484 RepID=A0A7R9IBJ7_9NEOP|nr:unnamed protein product [Timema tahoe]
MAPRCNLITTLHCREKALLYSGGAFRVKYPYDTSPIFGAVPVTQSAVVAVSAVMEVLKVTLDPSLYSPSLLQLTLTQGALHPPSGRVCYFNPRRKEGNDPNGHQDLDSEA